jgi:DNA-binding transcriptional ArsR family regulator
MRRSSHSRISFGLMLRSTSAVRLAAPIDNRVAMTGAAAGSDVFRAVADPTRRAILDLLREGDRSVRELARPFHISRPAISQHLRVLRRAGLVRARQVGRKRLYRLKPKGLREVYDWAARHQELTYPVGACPGGRF